MSVAQFPPPSLVAQLAELERERSDRLTRRDALDLAAKRATRLEVDHRNGGLDGAIATLETLVRATGQPGRRELIEALRRSRERFVTVHGDHDGRAELDELLAKVPE